MHWLLQPLMTDSALHNELPPPDITLNHQCTAERIAFRGATQIVCKSCDSVYLQGITKFHLVEDEGDKISTRHHIIDNQVTSVVKCGHNQRQWEQLQSQNTDFVTRLLEQAFAWSYCTVVVVWTPLNIWLTILFWTHKTSNPKLHSVLSALYSDTATNL